MEPANTACLFPGKPAAASGGVDILMDLLSVGTSSVPTDVLGPDNISLKQDSTQTIASLDRLSLSSPASSTPQRSLLDSFQDPSQKTKPNPGVSPVIDLLDGFNSSDLLSSESFNVLSSPLVVCVVMRLAVIIFVSNRRRSPCFSFYHCIPEQLFENNLPILEATWKSTSDFNSGNFHQFVI